MAFLGFLMLSLFELAPLASAAEPVCPRPAGPEEQFYPECIRETVRKHAPELEASATLEQASLRTPPSSCETCGMQAKVPLADLVQLVTRDYTDITRRLAQLEVSRSVSQAQIRSDLDQCMQRTSRLHELALQASSGVYRLETIPGYERTETFTFKDTGVKAYLLMPKSQDSPPIIAFSGTEDLTDLAQDAIWGVDQMKTSRQAFDRWVKQAYALSPKREIIVTGHSLGGALAQATVASMRPYEGDRIHLVTFNAFRAMDSFQLVSKKLGLDAHTLLEQNLRPLADSVHYRTEEDPVSLLGNSLGGQTRTLALPAGGAPSTLRRAMVATVAPLFQATQALRAAAPPVAAARAHSLKRFREALSHDPRTLIRSCPEGTGFGAHPVGKAGHLLHRLSEKLESARETVSQSFKNLMGGLRSFGASEQPKAGAVNLDFGRMSVESIAGHCQQGNREACTFRGAQHFAAGEITEAKDAYLRACQLGAPDCSFTTELFEMAGSLDLAEKAFKSACGPKAVGACKEAARVLERRGANDEATPYYRTACANGDSEACLLRPDTPEATKYISARCANRRPKETLQERQDREYYCMVEGVQHFKQVNSEKTEQKQLELFNRARNEFQASCDRGYYESCVWRVQLDLMEDSSPSTLEQSIRLLEERSAEYRSVYRERVQVVSRLPFSDGKIYHPSRGQSQESLRRQQAILDKRMDEIPDADPFYLAALYERAGRTREARELFDAACSVLTDDPERRALACYKVRDTGSLMMNMGSVWSAICMENLQCIEQKGRLSPKALAWLRSQVAAVFDPFPKSPRPSGDAIPANAVAAGLQNPPVSRGTLEALLNVDPKKFGPLSQAIRSKDMKRIDEIMAEGFDPNREPQALILAMSLGNERLAKLLVARGLSVRRDDFFIPPLVAAAALCPPMIEVLAQQGLDIHAYIKEAQGNPLEIAIIAGNAESVATLLKLGADPNHVDPGTGDSVLRLAEAFAAHPNPNLAPLVSAVPGYRPDEKKVFELIRKAVAESRGKSATAR